MKIALLSEKYTPDIGGLAVSVNRLAEMLGSAGHRVEVIAPESSLEPGRITCSEMPGIRLNRFGVHRRTEDTLADWFDLILARQKAEGFDLLHGFFLTQAGFLAAYAGQFLGLPSVVSARGNDLDRAIFDPGKAVHIHYALTNASAITANSQQLVQKAQALAPGRKAFYIPNGVDPTHFQPLSRNQVLAEIIPLETAPVLGFVGEARAKKGLATLLLAYKEICENRLVNLLMIGGVRAGDDKNLLQVFMKQNPNLLLAEIPYVPTQELPKYYNMLDVLMMPSLRDGLPNALLEGMACECAIVATPTGGIPDAINNNDNGVLIPPGDAHSLAEAALRLLDDPTLRQHLGHNARATILQKFSPTQEFDGNLSVYRQLLKHSIADED